MDFVEARRYKRTSAREKLAVKSGAGNAVRSSLIFHDWLCHRTPMADDGHNWCSGHMTYSVIERQIVSRLS